MESASTPRANQPRTGLRRPDYGPMQQHVLKKFPTTPHVKKRRTILDDSVLEALHQTHIGPQPTSNGGNGSGSGNGDGGNDLTEQVDETNSNEQQLGLALNDDHHWTSADATALQYMPQTPKRESRTFIIAPGSGRRTPRRRSRSSNQHLRTTPLKALADANQARVNRLISEANKRGRVGRDKHSPMGILRILSRIPGFNPPPQSLPDRQPIPGSADWRKLTPKSSRTNHIQMSDDPANPFSVASSHNTRHSSHSSSSRFERDVQSSAERRAYEKFRDQNPLLDPDDFNRTWEDEMGMTREGRRISSGVGVLDGEYDLAEDGDIDNITVVQGDIPDPFANPEAFEERSIHIGDITNTSQHGFLTEYVQSNNGNQDLGGAEAHSTQSLVEGDYLELEANLRTSDLQSDPNSINPALSASQQTSEDADVESGEQSKSGDISAAENHSENVDGTEISQQDQELDVNMDDGWEDILDDEIDGSGATVQHQILDASRTTDGNAIEDVEMESHGNDQIMTDKDLNPSSQGLDEEHPLENHVHANDLAGGDKPLDGETINDGDQIVSEVGREEPTVPEEEQQQDYEDGYMNVNEEDHIEQQEHDEQQDQPGVRYFDDFPSELGIMSSGDVLPTSLPAPKKTVRLSAAGIPVPNMPVTLQKQLVNTFSRSRVSQEAMAVILEGSHQFFEQAANDLAAYAEHAARKTIDESDVECLMKRITNEKVSMESLLQRYLPRELRDKVLYPEDMQHFPANMDYDSNSAQPSATNHDKKKRRLSGVDVQSDSNTISESIFTSEFVCPSGSGRSNISGSIYAQTSKTAIDEAAHSKVSHNNGRYTETGPSKPPSAIGFGDPISSGQSSSTRGTNIPRKTRVKFQFPRQLSVADSDQSQARAEHSQLHLAPVLNLSIAGSDFGDSMPSGDPQAQSSLDSEPTLGQEIIMAVNVKGRTIGFSYYDGNLGKLLVMQDMAECNPVIMAKIVKVQLRPTLILTNARLDDSVMDILRFDETGQETKIEVRPGGDFSYSIAKSRLISISINISRLERRSTSTQGIGIAAEAQTYFSEMDESAQRNAQLRLSNSIDLQSIESVGCAGAIIGFLSKHGVSHHAARGGLSLMVFAIEAFTVESFMFINPNSLSSLQIFEDESHPSMHSSIRGRKEGLSLYGILNQTKTSQGRYLLKQWLLRPSLDLSIIRARHQSVECFFRTENQPTAGQLSSCLSHIKNIPRVLQKLPRKATISEWQAILQILQQFVVRDLADIGAFINDVVRSLPEYKRYELTKNTFQTLNLSFVVLSPCHIKLDFDESMIEGRCVVKHNVDEELDRMRHTYHGLDNFLSEIAKEISLTIPSDFTSTINVIYFPQLGYLVTVPMNPNWKTDQDFYLEGLSYQFSTESTVYYKNDAMRDREIDILQGLQERILEYSQLLVSCSGICAELDVLMSLAHVARLRNYKRPTLTEENILHIVNGRHPLQELVVDSFVANSTHLGELEGLHSSTRVDETNSTAASCLLDIEVQTQSERECADNRVMILSGPNSSGKSIYLKQVALITYMAHIGSFVPAESAVVGLTDKILTRLQTRETVSSIQSALMTDLQQVITALDMATKRSLVVLDEFGKGTTSTDGAGMFCGVIEHFVKRTHDKPRVLATTHFHELFENNLLDLTLPISLYTMEVYQELNCLEATFLFRVIPGKTASSLGPACAAMAEMPLPIVQRGLYLSKLFQRYDVIVPMLTEREKSMQMMYEQLTGMLLHLDFDRELVEDEGSMSDASRQTSDRRIDQRHEKSDQHSDSAKASKKTFDTLRTDGGGFTTKETNLVNSGGSQDEQLSDSDDDDNNREDSLDKAIAQLMRYAAKVDQKEREVDPEYSVDA
ncbi:MutS protein msh5 [Mortierella sp. AM989]|nr:MutS protein msh5 [Mortierella sp. AM989]